MAHLDFVIGCIGKPSAGKSTFFNAVTEAKAKVGNFPFTTIEPNTGITYYRVECPCMRKGKMDVCAPRHGWCDKGTRYIPIKLLDVAGLIPGASEGLGLGNRFLDDLRGAMVLMHVVDVSGTTNEKGEITEGYDPTNDVRWLREELHAWIYKNLRERWGSIARRHTATKSTVAATLQGQLSGYGANAAVILETVSRLAVPEFANLSEWGDPEVHRLVDTFMDTRFPTVLVLNKADAGGIADKNIARITTTYPHSPAVVTSAMSECFLKEAKARNYIRYPVGAQYFATAEDEKEDGVSDSKLPPLEPCPPKTAKRLEKLNDMVMFRWGGTGVWKAVQTAVEQRKPIVAYPVRSLTNFATTSAGTEPFGTAMLLRPGTTVREFASIVHPEIGKCYLFAEGEDGRRLGEDDPVQDGAIIKFTTTSREESGGAAGSA